MYALEVDATARIIPDRIPRVLARVRADGRRPMALVANACSTALGLYDPLAEIGAACREQRRLAARGRRARGQRASRAGTHRALLRGVEAADSLAWDAHKLMRTPTLCAAVLVRDARTWTGRSSRRRAISSTTRPSPGWTSSIARWSAPRRAWDCGSSPCWRHSGRGDLPEYIERQFALAREAHALHRLTSRLRMSRASRKANILCFRIRARRRLQIAVT